jgi:isoamylase
MNRWATTEGSPFPLGASWVPEEQAYNFALYSKHADSVTLLFYGREDAANPLLRWTLDSLTNKSGPIWHCRIPRNQLKDAEYYAYSVAGPAPQGRFAWHCFDPQKILLDPYAKSIFFPATSDRLAAMRPGSNAGQAPLAALGACAAVDEKDARHPRHDADLIIYELHVRGFTNHPSSGVSPEKRGTYAGLIEKLPYLRELGVTAIELMPVFQFDPQERNFWGYMPLCFFAPHHGYATRQDVGSCRPQQEFRAMVEACHAADIEVLLDVVYNHTGEGNHNGPLYSFKGIDNSTYYLISDRKDDRYENYSGAGNTLNCANRYVRKMILDSLRHWVREMGVDGFRFDLASVFSRNTDGSINLNDPQLFADIVADPELGQRRLIAEPWDVETYQLGRKLPGVLWYQWNGRFRDDVRRFLRGDNGTVGSLMYRVYGSDDLLPDDLPNAYHPYQSVNYLTSHDGFTLYDLVSYNQKHNLANGHDNTDGADENYSWNCGWEGDSGASAEVRKLRQQQIKNFCCLLFLANGTPMLRAGDELLQTQGGNNNPYNQDNATSWLDWDRIQVYPDMFRFFQRMIAFRKAHPSLSRSRFWREDVHWYGTGPQVDLSEQSHTLAFCVHGASQRDDDIYVMINACPQMLPFTMAEGIIGDWRRVIDTSLPSPEDICQPGDERPLHAEVYELSGHAIAVFTRRRRNSPPGGQGQSGRQQGLERNGTHEIDS